MDAFCIDEPFMICATYVATIHSEINHEFRLISKKQKFIALALFELAARKVAKILSFSRSVCACGAVGLA